MFLILLIMNPHIKTIITICILVTIIVGLVYMNKYFPITLEYIGKGFVIIIIGSIIYGIIYAMFLPSNNYDDWSE